MQEEEKDGEIVSMEQKSEIRRQIAERARERISLCDMG